MKHDWMKHRGKCFNKGKMGMQSTGGPKGEDCGGIQQDKEKKLELEMEMITLSFHQSSVSRPLLKGSTSAGCVSICQFSISGKKRKRRRSRLLSVLYHKGIFVG